MRMQDFPRALDVGGSRGEDLASYTVGLGGVHSTSPLRYPCYVIDLQKCNHAAEVDQPCEGW
jgi:hypothetical protein